MKLLAYNTYDEMSSAALEAVQLLIEKSKHSINKFTIALSGGSSPAGFYQKLAGIKTDWSRICFFMVDERKVSFINSDSNFNMVRSSLLSEIDIPEKNIIPVNVSYHKPEDCALAYEERIKAFFNEAHVIFDLMILGIGPDGHTASLFPGREELNEKERLVISVCAPKKFRVKDRITVTLPVINNARHRFFIVSGKEKTSVVEGVLTGDPLYPASLVNKDSSIFTDFKI